MSSARPARRSSAWPRTTPTTSGSSCSSSCTTASSSRGSTSTSRQGCCTPTCAASGIEVLANSDNVVRAGLTRKEVNVPELLRVVDPRADGVAGRGR